MNLSFFENLIAAVLALVNPFIALWTILSELFKQAPMLALLFISMAWCV